MELYLQSVIVSSSLYCLFFCVLKPFFFQQFELVLFNQLLIPKLFFQFSACFEFFELRRQNDLFPKSLDTKKPLTFLTNNHARRGIYGIEPLGLTISFPLCFELSFLLFHYSWPI